MPKKIELPIRALQLIVYSFRPRIENFWKARDKARVSKFIKKNRVAKPPNFAIILLLKQVGELRNLA